MPRVNRCKECNAPFYDNFKTAHCPKCRTFFVKLTPEQVKAKSSLVGKTIVPVPPSKDAYDPYTVKTWIVKD